MTASFQHDTNTPFSDIILKVAGILTVKGGTGAIVEYEGPFLFLFIPKAIILVAMF